MKLEPNPETLLSQRYYKPGEDWEILVQRVIKNVTVGESSGYRARAYDQLLNRVWIPNSPTLANAGTRNGGLMACFVVGPDQDNLSHHFEVLKDIAEVAKRGGGCGFSGANIRYEGALVGDGSVHGYAYGPNAWAEIVNLAMDKVSQNGLRRMALMYSLPADHHDAEKFIELKQSGDEDALSFFNQSLFVSDDWMDIAVGNSSTREGRLLDRIAYNAWNNGEPGVLFDTRINTDTPYVTCGCEIITTNPCGEQPLPSYGSCNLGSINLAHERFIDDGSFSFSYLEEVVRDLTRFLDDVGSVNVFPSEKFSTWYEKHRPIGIGIMGFADLLLELGVKYGEKESVDLIADIMRCIHDISYDESAKLGVEKGVPEHCEDVMRRNITTTTIAPTGSIATIANVSHSLEPVFADRYIRTDEKGQDYLYEHPYAHDENFMCSVSEDHRKIPHWENQIKIQAAAQRWTDSGVSKTINMPNGATVEDVKQALIYAHLTGCKGWTIYRDGSRLKQVLKTDGLREEDASIIDCPTGVCEI